jgi:hypothetical protein
MVRDATGPDNRSSGVERPHCGICRHVRFRDDWDRTPYCSEQERPAEIRVGEVCSSFAPRGRVTHTALPDMGEDIEVHWSEQVSGTDGPFYAVYRGETRYDWLCGNCHTAAVAVDTMGRFECRECENTHRPSQWDAAYL